MIYLLYLLSAIVIVLGILSLRGGFRYLDYFRRELAKPKTDFTPFVSIIAPCRGWDENLKDNLRTLYRQNYPAYEIIFVVDDAEDPAVPIIEKAWKGVATEAVSKLVVASKATESGQKVHNLRHAVRDAADKSEIFVFVDSDARVGRNWLRNLVAPLADKQVGASTGYRWFVSKKRNFGSEMQSVWNASIASALGENTKNNFCWGGSMAIRRPTFERLKIDERWRRALSDDFTVMNVMRENELQIRFVPQCLVVSFEDCSFREMLEFTTRQMKITRVYAGHFWLASLFSSLLFTLVFYGLLILTVWNTATGESFWLPLLLFLVIFALGAVKAWVRLEAVKLILKDYGRELKESSWAQIYLFPLTPPVYLYNAVCAAVSRKIAWRGIVYEMKSPTETLVISSTNPPQEPAKAE
ncbi:MAG: glycosyltransferase family 2 protein [Acidobacteriota bacterium]|nr:glycosyltransferase family 2 protein [Acidobacteriota bacterium]